MDPDKIYKEMQAMEEAAGAEGGAEGGSGEGQEAPVIKNKCSFCPGSGIRQPVAEKAKANVVRFVCSKCVEGGVPLREYLANPSIKFGCAICDMVIATLDELQKHMGIHDWNQFNSCSLCGNVYSDQATLKRHIFKHKQDDSTF